MRSGQASEVAGPLFSWLPTDIECAHVSRIQDGSEVLVNSRDWAFLRLSSPP